MTSTNIYRDRLYDLQPWFHRLMMFSLFVFLSSVLFANDYVLLGNGNVIEGKTTLVGNHAIVDRGDGNQLKLPARQVVHSAKSVAELYRFRQSQRQYPHVEGFHDDARWCFRHHLFDEMKEAIDAAYALDPTHPETVRLRRQLVSAMNHGNGNIAVEVDSKDTQSTPLAGSAIVKIESTKAITHHSEEVSESELAKANLSFQAISYFNNRIQPLLINRCGNAGCHRNDSGSRWQLTHLGSHMRLSSRMTKLNLVATLALIDREDGQASDLLRYATTGHGGKQDPPLKRGDESAIESLRVWIDEVCQNESLDVEARLVEFPSLPPTTPAVISPGKQNPPDSISDAVRQVSYEQESTGNPKIFETPTQRQSRPSRLPVVENPFDPEIFNRNYRERGDNNDRDR